MLKMPKEGRSRDQVLADLSGYRKDDVDWRDGKAFAYVYKASEEATAVAERAFHMYMWENALDPTIFPSMLKIETELVSMAAAHLGGDDEVVGNVSSGGTESVLLAVKTARDFARSRKPNMGRGQVVLPVTAHPCFHKACQYFELDAVIVPVDPATFKADVDAMRAAITDDTVLLVGSATSYAHGVIDPIPAIGALGLEHDIPVHVDGCIGGFLLPFFRELGSPVTPFDFSVPGVTSISMDFHKYAFCPKGASVVLYKNADLRHHQIFSYSGWPGYAMVNPTVQSSKSGGPLAAAWAVMNFIGHDGYLELVRGMRGARDQIMAGIAAIDGLRVLGEPEMTLLAVGADDVDLFRLCDEMKKRGYTMHPQMQLGELEASFHINVVPINLPHVEGYLAALAEAVTTVRTTPASSNMAGMVQALSAIDLDKLSDAQIQQLLEMAGLAGGALPGGEMAEINHILNSLPPRTTDRVMTVYYNRLSRYQG